MTGPSDARPPALHAAYRNAEQIQPRPIPWLWPNWIPSAALTLLVADPGVGKSLLSADLAARLSRAIPINKENWITPEARNKPPKPGVQLCLPSYTCDTWPDSSSNPAVYRRPPTVAFLASQDCAEDALIGRLIAANADLASCRLIDGISTEICAPPHIMPNPYQIRPLRLPAHLDALEDIIGGASNTRLMIIDPLTDVLECPSAPATETLFALTNLARRLNLAILATIHLNKCRAHRTLYRIRGSLDYIAVARSALLLSIDPNNPSRRFLHQIKNSYAPLSPPLTFTIDPRGATGVPNQGGTGVPAHSENESGADVPVCPLVRDSLPAPTPAAKRDPLVRESLLAPLSQRVGWVEPRPANPTDDRLPPAARPTIPLNSAPTLNWEAPGSGPAFSPEILDLPTDQQSALLEACNWLRDQLADGSRPASEITSGATQAGITRATLYRAKDSLRVRSGKPAPDQPWSWWSPS